jgi:deazaflavin-dependent oxidoreductase (nitroreductase family)
MGLKETATDVQMKTMNAVHRTVRTLSGGRLGDQLGSMPVVELHTTGRKSGKRRSTMLTTPIHEADRIVLVASKGGDDRHPEWYLNLTADPAVELTLGGETTAMAARTATAAEKEELWPQIVAAYKGYAGYQRRTGRDIPVVICEARSS